MDVPRRRGWIITTALGLGLLAGCCAAILVVVLLEYFASAPVQTPVVVSITKVHPGDLTDDEIATLDSLVQVDDHPLYTMRYYGAYDQYRTLVDAAAVDASWGCSLFAALGDADHPLYGRNFDWPGHSPALFLFTDPPDGYASVSMVDIAYLGFGGERGFDLVDLSLAEREVLLAAPLFPFDGMNEHGLVVGMAAVPGSEAPYDPDKRTIGSLVVMREILDHARGVDEAVAIIQGHNVDWTAGIFLHYLIAEATGRAVLVEFHEGELVVIPNEDPWHLMTNHLRADVAGDGGCRRYRRMRERLVEIEGRAVPSQAMALLGEVSQGGSTQWSIVYRIGTGDVDVVMGGEYDRVYTFHLSLADE